MSLEEYINSSCCVCTADLNQCELYFIIFDYNNNILFKLLNSESSGLTVKITKQNKRFYLNVNDKLEGLESEFSSNEMVETYARKYYKNLYSIFLDKETKDIYFSFIENEKDSVLLGVSYNSPKELMLDETENFKISNFLLALQGDSKLLNFLYNF